jgi:hypothetical protein
MSIYFANLNGSHENMVRSHMDSEIQWDIEREALYLSSRLTTLGRKRWPELLREAAQNQTVSWLENRLVSEGLLLSVKDDRRVPVNAAQMLAEGEFNRFYCRGVCLEAIRLGKRVSVYRGKNVADPRWRSQALLGTSMEPADVLKDLRAGIGQDLIRGVPGGPNSGISLKLAEDLALDGVS